MEYPPILALLFCVAVAGILWSFVSGFLGGWMFDRRNPFLSEDER